MSLIKIKIYFKIIEKSYSFNYKLIKLSQKQ